MATRRTDQEWLAIFQQCERSSLTQSEFCRQHRSIKIGRSFRVFPI